MRLYRIESGGSRENDPWRAREAIPESGDPGGPAGAEHGRLWIAGANPLDAPTPEASAGEVFICRAGWFGEGDPSGPASGSDELPDPRLWTGEGWRRLGEAVERFGAGADLLWFRTGVGTVLGDPHVATRFAEEHPGVGLVADLLAMMTPAMLPDAEEHFERMAWKLGRSGALRGYFLAWDAEPEEAVVRSLGRAIGAHATPETRVILGASAAESAVLRGALGG